MLHVQTRAYPTYHRGLAMQDDRRIVVGTRTVALERGELVSLVYASQSTIELDVGDLLRDHLAAADDEGHDSGPAVEWARLRVLGSAAMLLTIAMRHQADVRQLSLLDMCDLDARIDRQLRERDTRVLGDLFEILLDQPEIQDPEPSLAWRTSGGARALATSSSVRYNCHFLTGERCWEPAARPNGEATIDGSSCRILLPYTYEWNVDPGCPPAEIVTMLEPVDLVVAQRSVLGAATAESLDMLDRLTTEDPHDIDVDALRRHVDRVRVSYHRLDAYRYDSSQRDRALYMAARDDMALDAIHERTDTVLAQAAESMQAAATARTVELDSKLNRLAALFTVAASGAFVLQAVEFAAGGPLGGGPERYGTLAAVLVALAMIPLALFVRRRRRAPRAGLTGDRAPIPQSRRAR